MPYLTRQASKHLDDLIISLVMTDINGPGELNYIFTQIAKRYLSQMGESYQTYNDLMGAFENAQFELYRRKIAGYEDLKKEANGDVY